MTAPPPIVVLVRPQLGENIGKAARAKSLDLLSAVRINDPEMVYDQYPHQVSGGMGQREGMDQTGRRVQFLRAGKRAARAVQHVEAAVPAQAGALEGGQAVGGPGDRVGLAGACGVLDQVVVTGAFGAGGTLPLVRTTLAPTGGPLPARIAAAAVNAVAAKSVTP